MDLSDKIREGHPGGTCPLCDHVIESGDAVTTARAHGISYLAHLICVMDETDDDDEE